MLFSNLLKSCFFCSWKYCFGRPPDYIWNLLAIWYKAYDNQIQIIACIIEKIISAFSAGRRKAPGTEHGFPEQICSVKCGQISANPCGVLYESVFWKILKLSFWNRCKSPEHLQSILAVLREKGIMISDYQEITKVPLGLKFNICCRYWTSDCVILDFLKPWPEYRITGQLIVLILLTIYGSNFIHQTTAAVD